MSQHHVIPAIISTVGLFVQLKFQSKTDDLSPFDANYSTLVIFFITLLTYLFSSAGVPVQSKDHDHDHDRDSNISTQLSRTIFNKVSILSGSLASILLLIIIISEIGWLALVLWTLYLAKHVYELVYNEQVQILDMLCHQAKKIFDLLSKMIKRQSETEQDQSLPV